MRNRNTYISSVAGVFEVIEVFSNATHPLKFSEIVATTEKSKATIHRILSTLIALGVVKKREDSNDYALTLKLWSLGMGAFASINLVQMAHSHVEGLMKATKETAHIATLDGVECVTYLYKVESAQSIRAQFWVGKRVRSWCSATGRSMLAFLPDKVTKLIDSGGAIGTDGKGDKFDIRELQIELLKVAKQGFAITKGDNHPEMGGIAAPIRDHTNSVIASCGIAIPAYRMNRQLQLRCIPLVTKAAAAISKELGAAQTKR